MVDVFRLEEEEEKEGKEEVGRKLEKERTCGHVVECVVCAVLMWCRIECVSEIVNFPLPLSDDD